MTSVSFSRLEAAERSGPLSMDAAPHPWHYNPSRWSQRVPICILAGVGFLIAAYMGLYQWKLIGSAWDPFFDGNPQAVADEAPDIGRARNGTETVLDSKVSETMRYWFLVPDAAFGAIAYLGDLIFGLAGSTRRWQYRPWLVVIFGIDVIPLGVVSVILVVMQGFEVQAWCFLCLTTAAISLILIYMAYDEVWSCLLYLRAVWNETQSARIVWKTFWGRPTPEAERVGNAFLTAAVVPR
ncbi:MAG: vitamin K epoxide reductase [Planctomycetes bacterium]|nr:vitamin K epoxide reductase [Planctomycetota bacterium]